MRIEPADRWLSPPRWAIALVGLYLSLVGVYALISSHAHRDTGPLCTFRCLTGLPCPMCGTTRMVVALVHGDVPRAAACNPLVFTCVPIALVLCVVRVCFGRRVVWITSDRSRRVVTAGLLVAVLANWAYLLLWAGVAR